MRKRGFTVATLVLLAGLFAGSAGSGFAFVAESGNLVLLESQEIVQEDVFFSGEEVRVEGVVNGDAFIAGNSVTISGTVAETAFVAGNTVMVDGEIGEGLRVACRSLTISGTVRGDLLVACSELTLLDGARVDGDVIFASRHVTVNGPVDSYVLGAAESIVLDSAVGGDATFGVERLTLGSDTVIGGDLRYFSENEAEVASGAVIRGEIQRRVREAVSEPASLIKVFMLAGFIGKIFGFLMGLLVGLVFILVLPQWMTRVTDTLKKRLGPSAGWGALVLFVTPLALLVTFSTVVGASLAVVLSALYLTGVIVGQIVTGLFIGRLVLQRAVTSRTPGALFGCFALGYFIVRLFRFIPFFGALVFAAAALFGLGAILLVWSERRKSAA